MSRQEIIAAIAEERKRQIMTEGYMPTHDDQWKNNELAYAASVYTLPEKGRHIDEWPFGEKKYHPLPMNRKKELIKAAALIVAEIERLERLEKQEQ